MYRSAIIFSKPENSASPCAQSPDRECNLMVWPGQALTRGPMLQAARDYELSTLMP